MNLKFKNPEFRRGRNTTVRKGYKWIECVGKTVPVTDLSSVKVGEATISKITVKPFFAIDSRDLVFEHDRSCRDIQGLFNVMIDVYPDLKLDDICLIIDFTFTEAD